MVCKNLKYLLYLHITKSLNTRYKKVLLLVQCTNKYAGLGRVSCLALYIAHCIQAIALILTLDYSLYLRTWFPYDTSRKGSDHNIREEAVSCVQDPYDFCSFKVSCDEYIGKLVITSELNNLLSVVHANYFVVQVR